MQYFFLQIFTHVVVFLYCAERFNVPIAAGGARLSSFIEVTGPQQVCLEQLRAPLSYLLYNLDSDQTQLHDHISYVHEELLEWCHAALTRLLEYSMLSVHLPDLTNQLLTLPDGLLNVEHEVG